MFAKPSVSEAKHGFTRRRTALTAAGCNSVHTLDFPDANRTTDEQIIDVADREGRAVVTRDANFVDTHILRGRPAKLLLISTGNASNRELEEFLVPPIPDIVRGFRTHSFLEVGRAGSVIRG